TERVLDCLEMNRSTYTLEELARMTNVTVPYVYNKQTHSHDAAEWPELGNYEVGGGVRSNVLDLMKYGELYLRGGELRGRSLVSPKLLQSMWQPVYPIGRMTAYGYALQSTPYGAVTLVEHGGSQPGVSSNFGFVPERCLTVAVLTNVTGVSANAIWLAAVNTALGLPLEQKRSLEPEYQAAQEELLRLVGTYRSDEGGNLRIFMDNEGLKVENEGEQFPLRASSDHTLVYEYRGQKVLRFHLRDGQPWAVFSGLRMLRRTLE
ncbi:MAG: serine hydrolase domain-containing protein, partial [Bacillota bacterium]